MPAADERVIHPYDEARSEIQTGDVLLYRGKSIMSRCIQTASQGPYSHVGLAGWVNGSEYARLFAYEMHAFAGGSATHLRSHAELWPGQIDVYHVSDMHVVFKQDSQNGKLQGYPKTYNRRKAMALMAEFCEPGAYGWHHLCVNALIHLPIIRWWVRPPTDDQINDRSRPPFCSEAVAYVLKHAFTDVVLNTPDHWTKPYDLAQSPLLHYKFTLGQPNYTSAQAMERGVFCCRPT